MLTSGCSLHSDTCIEVHALLLDAKGCVITYCFGLLPVLVFMVILNLKSLMVLQWTCTYTFHETYLNRHGPAVGLSWLKEAIRNFVSYLCSLYRYLKDDSVFC